MFCSKKIPKVSTRISKDDKILNFELLAVSFCMGPTIIYCLKAWNKKKNVEETNKCCTQILAEMHNFNLKFLQPWNAGHTARLTVECQAG